MKPPKNIAASVRQRLLNRARSDKRPFNELLQYYAMERFLYRLTCSAHAHRFILKGALMLRAWRLPEFRPTMDIDMLGRTSNEEALITDQFRQIMLQPVEADGIVFDARSIRLEKITEDADYTGIRLRFRAALDTARIGMQVDIGFGDIIYPNPIEKTLPRMLDFSPPTMLCYSLESAVAEKFEAMVKLGMVNSRIKDFYDIWLLSRQYDFHGPELGKALRITLEHRGTPLPAEITAFGQAFSVSRQGQWSAFRKRLQQDHLPTSFQKIVLAVKEFLDPVLRLDASDAVPPMIWTAPGPWTDRSS
jgi:predicted nucleotidyltransferase component of viral defense system